MCGIAGFSLSTTSDINPRQLSNALLSELDIRGNQASGFAFRSPKSSGMYKKAVAGASLPLKSMSRSSTDVLLHTRYATHGSIKTFDNNHPVTSPDKTIKLVHNGVIYNHELLRKSLDFQLPEVDTSVIPAILQQFDRNFDKLNMLDGDASIAWLDDNDSKTMYVARVSHSPLQIAQLVDGSFLFASTESIMRNALDKLNIIPEYCEPVPERTLLKIVSGVIAEVSGLPEFDTDYQESYGYDYGRYRNMTSGGWGGLSPESEWTSCTTDYDEFDEFGNFNESQIMGYRTPSGSDIEPRYVRVQSQWGDILVPDSWSEPANSEYPEIDGFEVNDYGQYYEKSTGTYMGDYDDMVYAGMFGDEAYM